MIEFIKMLHINQYEDYIVEVCPHELIEKGILDPEYAKYCV